MEEDMHPHTTGDFTALLHDLTFAIKVISRDVRRAGLNDVLGITRSTNVHGDVVRKLDKYSNEVIKKAMIKGGRVCSMASEEEQEIVPVCRPARKGKYVLAFDPLDGSSNIDVNITIGTIFSIYARSSPDDFCEGCERDLLQPGYMQEAAGYALYGSSTIFVYTTGHGVNAFTYDPTLGEFLLTSESMQIPKRGAIYSCNEGNYNRWSPEIRRYVDHLKSFDNAIGKPYNLRYIATGVADFHRALHYGGIYLYPRDEANPNGKFRLVYEANALAFIAEQAGGRATDGTRRILEIKPESIHQHTPLFIGSVEDVLEAESYLRGEA